MKEKYIRGKAGILVFTGISLAVLFTFSSLNQGLAEEPFTVKVSLLPYISYAPIFIALEEGYFSEQGLRIELIRFSRGGQSMPALVRGHLDVTADTTGASLFAAIARGSNIRIVADKGHLDPTCTYIAIMVRKDLHDSGEVTAIEQLKGRKVSLGSITNWGYIYEKILSKGCLTLEDIEIVRMPASAQIEAFATGAIDAASTGDPLITQLETLGYAVKLAKYEDFVPDYQSASIVFGPSLIGKNRKQGRKFMIAYLKGVRQYNEGKTMRNIKIFQKYTGLDTDILNKICLPPVSSDGNINTESILTVQDWMYENGYIDNKVTLDQLIDMSFAEYANEVLERKDM
ncbi:MAG: ABC transporter substrate-binding protein [Spirochaetota bacterium]|nr:MAG: ABC transporter substrate-binding protein [Spirochaetota bacterium]